MQGKSLGMMMLVGLLVFLTSMGVVYFFRLGQVLVESPVAELARTTQVEMVEDTQGVVVGKQVLADALQVLPEGTASARLNLTVSDWVPAKKEMQMFHAAEVGLTPAYGCSWRVNSDMVDLTLHVDKVRLMEVFADTNERDNVLSKFVLTCAAKADTGINSKDPRMQKMYQDIEQKLTELGEPLVGVQ